MLYVESFKMSDFVNYIKGNTIKNASVFKLLCFVLSTKSLGRCTDLCTFCCRAVKRLSDAF